MKSFVGKIFHTVLVISLIIFTTSCNEDEGTMPGGPGEGENVVTGLISSNTTWETGNTYTLSGRVTVAAGVTLTIEPGVVVKAYFGEGANASALLIAKGAKLNANGTAQLPIIFTSMADDITPEHVAAGNLASPNLPATQGGLWGGLIILGNAPVSDRNNAGTEQIEGIPPSDINGLYGGPDVNDNSGSIRYISIRHGGANIGEGNELNGLTLGGVGAGTTIEYVEVLGNQDDGIEWFGGTVNVNNAVVWNAGDDSYDSDQAWSGTVNNFIAVLGPQSDHGMEIDGPEGSINNGGVNTFSNGTIKSSLGAKGGEYADLRSNAKANLINIYFLNGKSSSDLELDNNGVANNYLNGLINFSNLQFNESHQSEPRSIGEIIIEKAGDNEVPLAVFETKPLDASVVVTDTPTVGATVAAFSGWTWVHQAGELEF